MDWEYWKLMSEEDQEEYDYRNIGRYRLTYLNFIGWFTLLSIVLFTFYATVVLLLKDYAEEPIKLVGEYVLALVGHLEFIGGFFLILILFQVVDFALVDYKEKKWLKDKGYNIKFLEFDLQEAKNRNKDKKKK